MAILVEKKKESSNSPIKKTFEIASSLINPSINVLQNVSSHYFLIIYKQLLRKRNQERHYKLLMAKAKTYEQYAAAGYMLDRCTNKDEWKHREECGNYDYELIKERLQILRTIRKNGDIPAMIFNLRTSLARNLGDMGNPKLYQYTNVGTKALIEDYIDEVTKQLTFICDADIHGFGVAEKMEFFKNLQKAFGRSALLLSGGGTFGLAHIGVLKALWEQKLLPKVVTGSSAGSIVAAILCCSTEKELQARFDPRTINLNFFERPDELGNFFIMMTRFLKNGVIRDAEVFSECMIANIGDMTFGEAYNRTGRILNITVSSSTNYEMPRLLNYLTAPNVLIRSAVAASSAVPLVFKPAPLMAKDANKKIVPWNSSGHRWVDGSLEGDLPMQRIRELFGVNHHLVAQANPHIIPFLDSSAYHSSRMSKLINLISQNVGAEFRHRLAQLLDLGLKNTIIFKLQSILNQTYVGDITIVPYIPWNRYLKLLSNPTIEMAQSYTEAGEKAIWPQIAILRNHCMIEQCIQQNILSVREKFVYLQSLKISPNTSFSRTQTLPRGFGTLPKVDEPRMRSSTARRQDEVKEGEWNKKEELREEISLAKLEFKPKGKANFHFGSESTGPSPYRVTLPSDLELTSPPATKSETATTNQENRKVKKMVRYSNSAENVIKSNSSGTSNTKPIVKRPDLQEALFSIDLTYQDSSEDD